MLILQSRSCHLRRTRSQSVLPSDLLGHIRHLWLSCIHYRSDSIFPDKECCTPMQSMSATNGWKIVLWSSRWYESKDMALQIRQMFHRYRSNVCNDRFDSFRLRVGFLRLHASVIQLAWQSADSSQWGECEDSHDVAWVLAGLWWWASHRELCAHKDGIQR